MEKLNIMKVRQLENKNQYVLEDDEKIIFQSYDSIIAVYDKKENRLTLGRDWDYSHTTLKHLYIFINEYCYNLTDNDGIVRIVDLLNHANNKKKLINTLIKNNNIKYESEVA